MKRRPDGFTLIEVLAAVAILATAFYFLLELRQSSLSSAIFASRRFIALQVARTKMEETLAEGFPDPKVESGEEAGVQYAINVMDIGDDENLGALRRIDVEVSSDIGFGEEGRIVLSTIVAPMAIKILPKPLGEEEAAGPPEGGKP